MTVATPTPSLAVQADDLRRVLSPETLTFSTTADIHPSRETIGQPRATSAISFGLEVKSHGYNVFAAGTPGSGRESTIVDALAGVAPEMERPDDWVYVFNFQDPDRPHALRLPPGKGARLVSEMAEGISAVQREIVRAFESEEYDRQRRSLLETIGRQRNGLFERLGEFAREHGFHLEMTPAGIISIPIVDGKPVPPDQFAGLPDEVRASIEEQGKDVQKEIAGTMRRVRLLDKEAAGEIARLDRSVTLFAVNPVFNELKEQYEAEPQVVLHFDQVRDDVASHYQEFLQMPAQEQPQTLVDMDRAAPGILARYEVNLVVDNSETDGAPIIIERHPTYYNLLGRINYRMTPGMMITDFRQIKPGALHRANGGFLVLHAAEVLTQPFAWAALKRSLLYREVQIENMGEQYSNVPAATLRPESIPLEIKVVLIGSRETYRLLFALDEDFEELFKVKADFAPDMPWDDAHVDQYLAFVSRYVRDNDLMHLDREAAARVVEYGARLQDHQQKLSTRLINVADVLTEATHWARKDKREVVQAGDIDTAIRLKEYRSNFVEERFQELIAEGTIDIETERDVVGQVNGLAVISLGDYAFGRPSRISARVSVGSGKIESIERAIKLSGAIHSKGFMILSGYLAGQYGQTVPLAVNASITFEQSYDEVEGDSASSAELYALLSALADTPIRQGIAVTGAVDQNGRIRAVGGVTRKIEGFFDVCTARCLDGNQGVIIPATNVRHLMLSQRVVDAVQQGMFTIWAVDTADQGIELLTGIPAGVRQADGTYPEDTVHGRVERSLQRYAEASRAFSARNDETDSTNQADR
jgi:lon-related putative ATP-dependent protease